MSFDDEVKERVKRARSNQPLRDATDAFMRESIAAKYSYNFHWLGRPIIQYPQDIVAMQEIIWNVKPDLIIETGIAHGGSLILYASLLELNALCGGPPDAEVLGIDIEIRPHNRSAIEAHPLSTRISMIEASSTTPEVVKDVHRRAAGREQIMVCLDSNHTHQHVLAELEAYAPLVSAGSYCVVFDTVVEDLPSSMLRDRPWGPTDNPRTAVREFLTKYKSFVVDREISPRLMISVANGGYLRRVE
jgi:cephalosporin hydroxylase